MRYFLSLILLLTITLELSAQNNACTTLGQTPYTAFPVCGIDTFSQSTVPYCNNAAIPVPGCGLGYSDQNPFWYKITCYQSGTLVFQITPNESNEDYDWQIFDITGHGPGEVYANGALFVVGNWCGTYGPTGTKEGLTNTIECASDPAQNITTYSQAPLIVQGHTYLLMVSHYSSTPNGYKLSFSGGTAVITDTTKPLLRKVTASCDGTQLTVGFNKHMKCASLAANGTDFTIAGTTSKVVSATGIGCSNSFNMDTVVLTLDQPLAPGSYQLDVQFGSDGTTVTDNCDQNIVPGTPVSFNVLLRQPTPFDSITPPGCAPDQVQLVFQKNIRCNSIAANGSDFSITGTYPVTVTGASGVCNNGLTNVINVKMSKPLYTTGSFSITLKQGTDGSTIIDECGEETVAGASLNFAVQDTVSADFSSTLLRGCRADTIHLFHDGNNGVTQWNWTFDNSQTSTLQNPTVIYKTFGDKTIQLDVTNGFCSDTATWHFFLDHDSLRAIISGPSIYCPNELATFRDSSIGKVIAWYWQFGNGNASTEQFPPPQSYVTGSRIIPYPVMLAVQSDKNCFDTTIKIIKAVNNCFIAVPSAFTPNHDGKNDYLYPLNAYRASNLSFRVYNKYGQMIYETSDWTRKWDGTLKGQDQPSGVYVWVLSYTDEKGQKIFLKGTTVLIR